ncbi:hypothetical protein AURDEDRAFT_62846, partial [Auricularia subglabra TFB-10046 SS5]
RFRELFQDRSAISQILGFWTTGAKTPKQLRDHVNAWMVSHVSRLANREATRITTDGWMRTPRQVTKQGVLAFRVDSLEPKFASAAPVMYQVALSFATARRQNKEASEQLRQRKKMVMTQAIASLLREHSRDNNLVATQNGLYLYAAGAKRQTISVLSHAGWCCSYPRLVDNSSQDAQDTASESGGPSEQAPGLIKGILPSLSASCMQDARTLAASRHYSNTYDNINFTDSIAEQTIGRKDAQINMTNATSVPLHGDGDVGDLDEALNLDAAQKAFLAAKELDISDLLFTDDEADEWRDLLIHTVEEIVVDHGIHFEHFRAHLEATRPMDRRQIRQHKTALYPLQTMDIDEALVTGNIDVVDEIHLQLGVDLSAPGDSNPVRVFFGDQLTIARQRSIIATRAGHELGAESWNWDIPVIALFHTDMAAVSCVLSAHWGRPDTGTRNPGSLWFHNTRLDRKPIVLSSLPPYRTCRDLIFVSLYARVLHCLLLVSAQPDLSSCASSVITWDDLHAHATNVCDRYALTPLVGELRAERRAGGPGDMVFENAALFMRDALALRTFARAVKSGRSGHIVLALKWLALMFKGGGHPKYAREMLALIHNIAHVWPPKLRDLILQNWLINPTGTKDGWVALDLMQEHLNFWIKRIYAAHGSNASWEWLAMIAPCIEVLRGVANHMHETLGSYQGRKHTVPNLSRDINELMKALSAHSVYTLDRQRKYVGEDTEPVVDLLTQGLKQMTYGSNPTLKEYNTWFRTLQARSRVKPLQPYEERIRKMGAVAEPTQGATPVTATDMMGAEEGEAASEQSDTSSESEQSSIPDEYAEYDELYLCLLAEEDVELDPDSIWQESEDSGEEQDSEGDGTASE